MYYTASGILFSVSVRPVHRLREDSLREMTLSETSLREYSLNLRTARPPTVCDDSRCCIIQFDLLMTSTWCSKHVEAYNKLITKQEFVP